MSQASRFRDNEKRDIRADILDIHTLVFSIADKASSNVWLRWAYGIYKFTVEYLATLCEIQEKKTEGKISVIVRLRPHPCPYHVKRYKLEIWEYLKLLFSAAGQMIAASTSTYLLRRLLWHMKRKSNPITIFPVSWWLMPIPKIRSVGLVHPKEWLCPLNQSINMMNIRTSQPAIFVIHHYAAQIVYDTVWLLWQEEDCILLGTHQFHQAIHKVLCCHFGDSFQSK